MTFNTLRALVVVGGLLVVIALCLLHRVRALRFIWLGFWGSLLICGLWLLFRNRSLRKGIDTVLKEVGYVRDSGGHPGAPPAR